MSNYMIAKHRVDYGYYAITPDTYKRNRKLWELKKEDEERLEMTYQELKEALDEQGTEYKKNASKETLKGLLR